MRILHIGLCVDGKNEGLPYALKQAATEYIEINPGDNKIVDKIKACRTPDIVFCQIQSEKIQGDLKTVNVLGPHLKQLKDQGAFIVNWSGDMRMQTPQWYYEFAPYVSVTCFSNMQDVNNFRGRGLKSEFLQIGIDPLVFTPDGPSLAVPSIVFMANNYHNQFPLGGFRKNISDILRRTYGNSFGLYGNGWNPTVPSYGHSQLEEAKVYRGAKIAISVSHFDSDRYFSDRLLRAMACGVSVISHQYKGLDKDFIDGLHLTTFSGPGDLLSKVDYLLNNEDIRASRAKEGASLVHSEYTYKRMVEHIIKLK